MSIGKKAGKGFAKLFQRNMLEKLMGLTTIVILARKLTPYDFGLVSITEVLLYTISVFGSTGISEFLLAYKKEDEGDTLKAAFWFNGALTIVVLLVFLAAAPFWANMQNDDRILNISFIAAGIFFFSQLSVIPKAKLGRNLMFDKQVKVQKPFIILIPLGKVAAVYAGWGVYSLILPTLIFQPFQTFAFFRASKFVPGTSFYLGRWKEIFNFTKHLIGSGLLRRLADQGEKFILSSFLGLGMLGIYDIAKRMAELFITQLIMISNNVLSAVLPKYTSDKDKFYSHYINFLKTFSFAVLPVLAIMLIAAKPLILILYGEKWLPAVLPMQILLVYTALRSVTSSFNIVMNAFHRNLQSFKVNLLFTPAHLIGAAIGVTYGVVGVAVSLVVVRSLFYNWRIKLTMDSVSKPAILWYKDLAPYFINILFVTLSIACILYVTPSNLYQTQPILLMAIVSLYIIVLYNVIFRWLFVGELNKINTFLAGTFPVTQRYFKAIYKL